MDIENIDLEEVEKKVVNDLKSKINKNSSDSMTELVGTLFDIAAKTVTAYLQELQKVKQ